MEQDIVINGIKYIPEAQNDSPVKIVVLQRGWVAIGRWGRDGSDCKLTDASIIRKWGTTKGLGELASGPLSDTILDKAGIIGFDYLTVVCTIECDEESWKSEL